MVHLPRITKPGMHLRASKALTGGRPVCSPRPTVQLSDWSRKNGRKETTWTSVRENEKEIVSTPTTRSHNVAMRSVRIGPYLLQGPSTPMGRPLAHRPANILTPAKQVMVNSARFYSRVSQVSNTVFHFSNREYNFQHNTEHVNFLSVTVLIRFHAFINIQATYMYHKDISR